MDLEWGGLVPHPWMKPWKQIKDRLRNCGSPPHTDAPHTDAGAGQAGGSPAFDA